MDESIKPREGLWDKEMRRQRGESELEQTPVPSERQFLPEEETFRFFLKDLLPRINPQEYIVASVLLAVPHWLEYVQEHSLAEPNECEIVSEEMVPIFEEIHDRFRKKFPDRMILDEMKKLIPD